MAPEKPTPVPQVKFADFLKNSPEIKALLSQSGLDLKEGDFETAAKNLAQAAELTEESLGPRSRILAPIFTSLMLVHRAAREPDKAVKAAKQLVADHDGLHGSSALWGDAPLDAGYHAIEVEFFQHLGGIDLKLEWSGPGFSRCEVPAAALSH